ncbi:hypothetical protein [sulfur-oxidizing endosymbiont of Gigantopelta aegis]|uniref:hypothetical protein n=1 Tax=sulfur-oxidizing endosymbiont of Gigantopelta aegis TaxID=2794934 RepID=UPI0018DBFAEC|nr:hypothetical protein [sulfur-oxidizing endosymbiont of Gigantopelta aegis]
MGKLYVDGLNFNWDNCYYASQYDVVDDANEPSEKDLIEASKARLIDNKGYEAQTNNKNYSVSSSRGKLINIPTYPFQRKKHGFSKTP